MKHAYTLKWSFGNAKLEKTDTVSFSLPAFKSADGFRVCPGSGVCAAYCYARQGRYIMPDVQRTREHNLAIVRGDLARFEVFANTDLAAIRQTSIRLHDSGDFFSQAYLDAWFRVMRANPGKRFYAYTKSLHLDWTAAPANFTVIQSVGGNMDARIDTSKSHTRVFATHADRKAAGYCNGSETDRAAQQGKRAIGLVYHGTTKLTPKMAALFATVEVIK